MLEDKEMDVEIKNIEEVFDDGQDEDENGAEQDEDSSPYTSYQEVLIKIDEAVEFSDDNTEEWVSNLDFFFHLFFLFHL